MEDNNDAAINEAPKIPRHVPPFLVADSFGPEFLDEAFCTRIFLDMAHGRLAHCPECKEELNDDRQERRYYEMKKFNCKKCGSTVTSKKGTVLENCSLKPSQYLLLALFLEIKLPVKDIARMIKMSAENVRICKGKLNAR